MDAACGDAVFSVELTWRILWTVSGATESTGQMLVNRVQPLYHNAAPEQITRDEP